MQSSYYRLKVVYIITKKSLFPSRIPWILKQTPLLALKRLQINGVSPDTDVHLFVSRTHKIMEQTIFRCWHSGGTQVSPEDDAKCSDGGVDLVGINYSALKEIEDKLLMVEPLEFVVRRCEFPKTLEHSSSMTSGFPCLWSISQTSLIEPM